MGIILNCRCGNSRWYDRAIDGKLPINVQRIVTDKCPLCDDGDFGSETWYDAKGCEVSQDLPYQSGLATPEDTPGSPASHPGDRDLKGGEHGD